MQAQREAVPVSSHGQEYEELRRLKTLRRHVFATGDLPRDEVERIAATRMDPRHDYLNALLDPKYPK